MRQRYLALPLLLICAVTTARAQQHHADGAPPGQVIVPAATCPHGSIASITIANHSIFDADNPDHPGALRLVYRVANAIHPRTRASVIRRDLLFRQGDCYDPTLVAESERLLRDNQFLASARIIHHEREDGDHDLVVETRDEWSARLDIRASLNDGLQFNGASLRESNFLGTGQTIELFYLDYDANRDYGMGFHTHQLAGSRWHLGTALGNTRVGPLAYQTLAYPFREETGRWAAREEYRQDHRYFDFLIDEGGTERHLLLPTRTRAFDLAAIHRFGRPGSHFTLGAAVTYTDISFPGGTDAVEFIHGDDFDDPQPADSLWLRPLLRQARPQRSLRTLLLLGQRRIAWTKRQGFDTLRGEQDIRLGTELGLALGRSLTAEHTPHHLFTALDLYAGHGTESLLLTGRLRGDARRYLNQESEPRWNDIFAETEFLAYWKPRPAGRQTLVLRATATGGWQTRSPFQLILGGDLGVRGYPRERFPGGRRLVFSLEDRITFDGPFRDLMDLGATAFLDVGRIWPGDAPYGIDSGWRASAGIGLRNALPSGGRRTYRIDLALPIQRGAGWRDLRLILSVGELIGLSPSSRRMRVEEMQRFTARNPFHFPN